MLDMGSLGMGIEEMLVDVKGYHWMSQDHTM